MGSIIGRREFLSDTFWRENIYGNERDMIRLREIEREERDRQSAEAERQWREHERDQKFLSLKRELQDVKDSQVYK